jgi:protein-disulfide isomerase
MRLTLFSLALTAGLLKGQAPQVSPKPAAHKPAAPVEFKGPSAFDKKQFEVYVRHLFVWAPPIEVAIGDPQPSKIAGFVEVRVHAFQGNASQDELFYISKNGRQIIRGSLYDIAENPFKTELSKIKTDLRPSFGTPGAPVVIAEFSDFQCHFCKEEAKIFRENLLKEYPTQVRFYFMDFPIEALHPWAKAAAIAGRCVVRQNALAFWDYHDWIFEHQEETTVENLEGSVIEWAKGKGLDTTQLASCMDTKATESEVDATVKMGHALEVNSTPTAFINGRPMVGATPWTELKRVIDFEIGYQDTAKNAGENCGCDLSLPKTGVK